MGMNSWLLLAGPLLQGGYGDIEASTSIVQPAPTVMAAASNDPFSNEQLLTADDLANASGGSDTAIDIGYLGVNIDEDRGLVRDVSADGATNGEIAENFVSDNDGITTVLNNTGNGVIFQNTVQVNIYFDSQP